MSNHDLSSVQQLRICYFGTYRANYSRSRIILAGLHGRPDVQVYECHSQLWQGIEDRVEQAGGGWRSPRFWTRVLKAYWRLFRKHNQVPEYDVMLIGYPGQFDSYLARLLTWWRRKPVALDILMSLHLVAEERGLTEKSLWTGRLIFWLEKGGLKLPDLLISENDAYEGYYCRQYGLDPQKFHQVPHGADDRIFYPREVERPEQPFRVTYHGMYLPSHGMDAIIGAASLLRKRPDIQFHFFGSGPEKERLVRFAQKEGLPNMIFHGFVDRDELLDSIASSHISLGVFGETRQSHYTIQNKIWEGLAMARPVISGDSRVVRESLEHGRHIYLVPRENPQALADAIILLKENPEMREAIAQAGYQRFLAGNSIAAIGRKTEEALRTLF
ncbi:MAG: glycosyltransferase family 4 protein [Candidatus Promineifilaceae bacterium]|jgi:glycosyltransferase involved in cell wall biosynthesis